MDRRTFHRTLRACINLACFFVITLAYDAAAQSFGAPPLGVVGACLIAVGLAAIMAVLTSETISRRAREHESANNVSAARTRVSVLLIAGIAMLLLSLGTHAFIVVEIARRESLGPTNFCTCPDCEIVYWVWSLEADEVYAVPLGALARSEAALRTAAIMTIAAGLFFAGAAALAGRVRRNPLACPFCRYDRTRLPLQAVCPECGRPASDSSDIADDGDSRSL